MLGPRLYGFGLVFSFFCFILTAAAQKTFPSEVKALVQIKKSLIDPKNHLRNWNKGDPCASNWTGVWCFNRVETDGYFHVHELYLMTSNLSGSLAPQLGQLSQLQIMNFMWNDLTGTIPKEIGNIKSLRLLLLNGNKLSGSLPDELGNLSNLNRLQLDQNQLSGSIPQSFTNLINVKHLHLNNNSLTGQIPRELSKLPNLLHLLVDNNKFSGHLPPEFSMLPVLRILYASVPILFRLNSSYQLWLLTYIFLISLLIHCLRGFLFHPSNFLCLGGLVNNVNIMLLYELTVSSCLKYSVMIYYNYLDSYTCTTEASITGNIAMRDMTK